MAIDRTRIQPTPRALIFGAAKVLASARIDAHNFILFKKQWYFNYRAST